MHVLVSGSAVKKCHTKTNEMRCSVPIRRSVLFVTCAIAVALAVGCAGTQPQSGSNSQTTAGPAPQTPQVSGDLGQVMQGILFPASNVIFAAQGDDPAKVKPASDPATATDPLTSVYGGWKAVENAGLALAESANLLTIPGRKCGNGRDVPIQNADWAPFVQGLRDAGMAAFKAAQSKNQDNILQAADTMTTACASCHDKYREKPTLEERCM